MEICGHDLPTVSADWNQSNWGLTKEQHNQAWEVIRNTVSFYEHLDVLPGVDRIEAISKVHRLVFVTTRPPTEGNPIEIQSAKWLSKLGVQYPTVVVADNKGPVVGALALDYFIDDKPENLLDIHEHSFGTKLYIKTQPYNVGFKHLSIERVDTFNSFISEIWS